LSDYTANIFSITDSVLKEMDMGKLILVTGGARSGKSSFAEEHARKLGKNIIYIATAIPFDEEMKLRVKKHREQRPSHWETVEAYKDLDCVLKYKVEGKDGALLDCITVMITNIMMDELRDWDNIKAEDMEHVEKRVNEEIKKLLSLVESTDITFIVVTNEVGMGIVPEYPSTRLYRDVAGRANQMIAKEADEVYLCVSGIPMKIK
jgi:adenosylcobinamide kinase/adenosylcobinamide-phosphate guanylyltransferase